MQTDKIVFNLSDVTYRSFGTYYELPLEGGLFRGKLRTVNMVPDGVVLKLSVQNDRIGNGPQRVQSVVYRVRDGKGVAL
jgi:hypothetical protein